MSIVVKFPAAHARIQPTGNPAIERAAIKPRHVINLDALAIVAALMVQQRVLYDLVVMKTTKCDLEAVEIIFQGVRLSGAAADGLLSDLAEDEACRLAYMGPDAPGRLGDRLRRQVRRLVRGYRELRRFNPKPPRGRGVGDGPGPEHTGPGAA